MRKMKLLWVSSTPVFLQKEKNYFREGWIQGIFNEIAPREDITMAVVYPMEWKKEAGVYNSNGIQYYGFHTTMYSTEYEKKTEEELVKIISAVEPDIIHLWGTERMYALAVVNAARTVGLAERVVVNIQGLVSVFARYYTLGVPEKYQKGWSIPELWCRTSLIKQAKEFEKRGRFEIRALKNIKYVIGRSDWDEICVKQINPDVYYYFCNEILRPSFYEGEKWNIETCERHSIFISQGLTTYKGMHMFLQAALWIKSEFPDVKIYSTGQVGRNRYTKHPIRNSYENYLFHLIQKYHLEDHVHFLGYLDEKQMRDRFLNSHVYVNASAIENESNALSEAKILGVPSVAAYEGGVTKRIEHGVDGFLYPFHESNILAEYVCRIFRDDRLAVSISENAARNARTVNDRETNGRRLMEIYSEMMEEKNVI